MGQVKHSQRQVMQWRISHALQQATIATAIFLGGCATFHEGDCGRYEQLRKQMRYETRYVYDERETGKRLRQLEPLPPTSRAAVPIYTLALDRTEIRPCSHLTLAKAVFLQRTAGKDLVFEEVHEYYAESGVRITEHRENLTVQLATSGYYTAKVPLPIPAKAPPGQYRIVSKLVLRQRGQRQRVLAQASAAFRVLSGEQR